MTLKQINTLQGSLYLELLLHLHHVLMYRYLIWRFCRLVLVYPPPSSPSASTTPQSSTTTFAPPIPPSSSTINATTNAAVGGVQHQQQLPSATSTNSSNTTTTSTTNPNTNINQGVRQTLLISLIQLGTLQQQQLMPPIQDPLLIRINIIHHRLNLRLIYLAVLARLI